MIELEASGTDPSNQLLGARPSRRIVLRGTVATGALAAVAGLTGCGSDGGGATTSPGAGGTTTGGPEVLAKTSDIPVGSGKIFAAQRVVVTQPTAGDFKGFSAVCTHQGCTVESIDSGVIGCPCHGSRYSIEDARVLGGPAKRALATVNIRVDGDQIILA